MSHNKLIINNPFHKPVSEYKCRLSPVTGAIAQSVNIISKTFDIDEKTAKQYLRDMFKDKGVEVPTVRYNGRDKVGDKIVMKEPLDSYINKNINSGNIIVPSFTVYSNPKRKESLHNGYVLHNLKARTDEKKLMKQAMADGNDEKVAYHDVLQKVKKIFNNSLSGAYGSKGTILCNFSAHYTLTSMTRAVASVGNAITEMVSMGNRHYTSTDTVLAHFASIVINIDMNLVYESIEKYNLHIPTIDEIISMVRYSSDLYYRDPKGEVRIRAYLSNLNRAEIAALMYVNDLYQIRENNPKVIRRLYRGMGTVYDRNFDKTTDTLNSLPEWIKNLTHMINSDVTQGQKLDYDKIIGTPVFDRLTGTAENIIKTLDEFNLLIKSFFMTPVMPIDIVDIKSMIRRAIVISDTDSTCGAYDDHIRWYYSEQVFGEKASGISAAVMSFVTQTMDHYLKQLSVNMNIPEDKLDILEMKNEFYWEVIVPLNVSKHYYAGIKAKEGHVFDIPKLEIKGIHLIASSVPAKYKERAKSIYMEIINTITSGGEVDIASYLNEVALFEKDIIKGIRNGDVSLLSTAKIKAEKSYKQDWKSSPHYHYKLWNEVFKDKYGEVPPAPISTIKVNTTLDSKNKILAWIDNIEDPGVKSRMEVFYKSHQKGSLGVFQLPSDIVSFKGIPEELLGVMNETKLVLNICAVFYIILETCGYGKPDGLTLTDLGL